MKQATPVWFVFMMAIIIYSIFPIIGFIVVKLLRIKKNEQGLYMFMIAFSNVAFMGIPVMNAIYGPESIFYLTIYNMLFNLCLYLYEIKIFVPIVLRVIMMGTMGIFYGIFRPYHPFCRGFGNVHLRYADHVFRA